MNKFNSRKLKIIIARTSIMLISLYSPAAMCASSDINSDLMAARERQHQHEALSRHQEHTRTQGRLEKVMPSKKPKEILSSSHSKRAAAIKSIVFKGNRSISSKTLRKLIADYIGVKPTPAQLENITTKIENYYKEEGYLLPIIAVHAEKSMLTISVIEGKIREVQINLEDPARDKKVLANARFMDLVNAIKAADPLRAHDIERYILLMNKIHGYKVSYGMQMVEGFEGNAVADIILSVSTDKGTASLSADNSGSKTLGRHHFTFNTQLYNPISNDSFVLNAGTSDKYKKYEMLTGGYLKRLNSYGTSLSVYASYLKDNPMSASSSQDNVSTILKGKFDQYIALNNDYSIKLEAAAEQRDISTFDGKIKSSDYKYPLGSVGGKIKIVDGLDVDNWFYTYYFWTLNDVEYNKLSSQSQTFDKNFNYFTIDWYRTQPFPGNFELMLHAAYQGTSKKLPSEYQYSIGSSRTGRGYKPSLVSSDQGAHGGVEFKHTIEFKNKISAVMQRLQLFAFYDITKFIDHNNTATSKNHPGNVYYTQSTFQSVGGGVRAFFAHGFFGECVFAKPLTKHVNVSGVRYRNKNKIDFFLSKEFKW